jgi:hypothetical protein
MRRSNSVPKLTHVVTPSPHRPIKGKHTRTDKAPMSTSEYSGKLKMRSK